MMEGKIVSVAVVEVTLENRPAMAVVTTLGCFEL